LARPLAQGSHEPVYVLDHGGARLLSLTHGEVQARPPSRLPKAAALDHLLEVVAVRVALSVPPPQAGVQLLEWLPGENVRFRAVVEAPGQRRQSVSLIPDAGMVVRTQANGTQVGGTGGQGSAPWQRHYAFLEVDRGTEAARHLAAKVRAYAAYWSSGGFAQDFSVPRGLGFWVLLVAPTAKRAQTILKAIAAVEGPRVMFRIALAEDITPGRISEAVWQDGATGGRGRFWEVPPA
jgi:hypothetical protein